MVTISADGRIPVASMMLISPRKPPVGLTAMKAEEFCRNRAEREAEFVANNKAAREQMDAVKVHTVFRSDEDKIIAVQYRDGSTTFASYGDRDHRFDAEREGRAKGLTGDALNDYTAKRMAETLKKQYGYTRAQSYTESDAPTYKEITNEMFNASRWGNSAYISLVNLTADTLELMSGS